MDDKPTPDRVYLTPEGREHALLFLAESWAMTIKPSVLKRWRRKFEWVVAQSPLEEGPRQDAAVWVRGLFRVASKGRDT